MEPVNHASWLDAWGRGLVVPPSLDPAFSSVNHLLKKEAGLHALFETTKAGGGLFH